MNIREVLIGGVWSASGVMVAGYTWESFSKAGGWGAFPSLGGSGNGSGNSDPTSGLLNDIGNAVGGAPGAAIKGAGDAAGVVDKATGVVSGIAKSVDGFLNKLNDNIPILGSVNKFLQRLLP